MKRLSSCKICLALILFSTFPFGQQDTRKPTNYTGEGRFELRRNSELVFQPRGGGLAKIVSNREIVGPDLLSVDVWVTGEMDDSSSPDGRSALEVLSMRSGIAREWTAIKDRFGTVEWSQTFENGIRELEGSFAYNSLRNFGMIVPTSRGTQFLSLPAAESAGFLRSRYFGTLEELISEVKRLYRSSSDDSAERRASIALATRLFSQRKARFAYDDRFSPQTFLAMFRRSRGGVAIWYKNKRIIDCSGVLIGVDLVLTSLHCVDGSNPSDLEIWIDYEEDLEKNRLPVRKYPVQKILAKGSVNLDFALLQVSPSMDGKKPGDETPIQTLSSARVGLDDLLYVVGHPQGGPRLIADNAFALFPYEITQEELDEIKLRAEVRYLDSPDRKRILQEIDTSYKRKGEKLLHLPSKWFDNPTIGADCDTFHGNSGSPVYLKSSHTVIGILFAGEPDRTEPWEAGWKRHEAILAIGPIIEAIQDQFHAWGEHGMTVQ